MEKTNSQNSINLFELGKNSFILPIDFLRDRKKELESYKTYIEKYQSENRNHCDNLSKLDSEFKLSLTKNLFSFGTTLNTIIHLNYKVVYLYLKNIKKTFDNIFTLLNETINSIQEFISNSQNKAMNIENKRGKILDQNTIFSKSLDETISKIFDNYIKKKFTFNLKENDIEEKDKLLEKSKTLEIELFNIQLSGKELITDYIKNYNNKLPLVKEQIIKFNESVFKQIQIVPNLIKLICKELFSELDKRKEIFILKEISNENLDYQINDDKELNEAISIPNYSIKFLEEENDSTAVVKLNKYKPFYKKNSRDQVISLSDSDIYNIVEEIYKLKFKTIDENQYNLKLEKQKIEIVNLSEKLLSFDLEKNLPENISDEEIEKLYKMIGSNNELAIRFLLYLNNFRGTGKFELTKRVYNTVLKYLSKIADNIIDKSDKKINHLIIILSQTFYIMKNNNKYFLQQDFKTHKYFQKEEYWRDNLVEMIVDEIKNMENDQLKYEIKLTESKKQKKICDIVFSKIIAQVNNMNQFNLSEEKIKNVVVPLLDKYNISEDMRKSIEAFWQK